MDGHIFAEISLLIALAAGVSIIIRLLKQPLIIGYILTGVLVGPALLGIIGSPEAIADFGSFGVALLLFIVGIGLNPTIIKEVGKVSLLTGVGQVLFTSLIGLALTLGLGFDLVSAVFISMALAFSSTIIILKLLTDKKEQNKLHGKISIGFLLVQDIIAALALVVASAMGSGGLSLPELGGLLVKGAALILAIILVSRYVLHRAQKFLSNSLELLFLFAIAWGFGVAQIFHSIGLSLEIGALIAGVALSGMNFATEVASRLRPVRDFFLVVFFVALGANLSIADVTAVLPMAIILSAFVLVGNPIIVMVIMGLLGYTKKTSFKAGLVVAQISEFSIILVLVGERTGQLSSEAVSLVTMVGIITIAISTYMILYSDKLYGLFERYLTLFERRKLRAVYDEPATKYDLVLFGYHKGGHEFVKIFKKLNKPFVVVDYDPEVIDKLEHNGINYLYGDANDSELLREAGVDRAKLVVSTMADQDANTLLVKTMAKENPNGVIITHASSVSEAESLYSLGASYVIMPHYIGSEKIGGFIQKSKLKKSEFSKYRRKHIEHLRHRFEEANT